MAPRKPPERIAISSHCLRAFRACDGAHDITTKFRDRTTAYRSSDPVRNLRVFLRLRSEDGWRRYDDLIAALADVSAVSGLQLVASISKEEPFLGSIRAYRTESVHGGDKPGHGSAVMMASAAE